MEHYPPESVSQHLSGDYHRASFNIALSDIHQPQPNAWEEDGAIEAILNASEIIRVLKSKR